MRIYYCLPVLVLLMIPVFGVAQDAVIVHDGGSSTSFPIDDVRSITFDNGQMFINEAGTSSAYVLQDKPKLTFGEVLVGVEDSNEEIASIFPNPANDHLHFNSVKDWESFKIVDMTGREWMSGSPNENGLDISFLPSGIYAFIAQGVTVSTNSFIKE